MWLILIFIIIISIVLGVWMYNKIITKNVVEYHSNGKTKLIGVAQFNKRIGIFELYDDEGTLNQRMYYREGVLYKEEYLNPENGNVWKEVENLKQKVNIDLRFADKKVISDRDIVILAVKSKPSNLQYISSNLRNDRDVVLEAVKHDGGSLKYSSKELKGDKEIVLEAVNNRGMSLEFASEELQNDKEIVLVAVKQNGMSLEFASYQLKNDRTVVIEALNKREGYYIGPLRFCSDELRNDRNLVLKAVKTNPNVIKLTSEEIQNDRKIYFEAVKGNSSLINLASYDLIKDLEFLNLLLNNKELGDSNPYLERVAWAKYRTEIYNSLFEKNKELFKSKNQLLYHLSRLFYFIYKNSLIGLIYFLFSVLIPSLIFCYNYFVRNEYLTPKDIFVPFIIGLVIWAYTADTSKKSEGKFGFWILKRLIKKVK